MNRLDRILNKRKLSGITWNELAENLPVTGEALRIAFKRGNVQKEYLNIIESKLDNKQNQQVNKVLDARFEDIVARRVIEIITPILEKLGENQKSALGSVDDFKVTMQHLLLDLDELKDEIEEVKDLVKQSDSKLDKLV
jgi:hypothetical protein